MKSFSTNIFDKSSLSVCVVKVENGNDDAPYDGVIEYTNDKCAKLTGIKIGDKLLDSSFFLMQKELFLFSCVDCIHNEKECEIVLKTPEKNMEYKSHLLPMGNERCLCMIEGIEKYSVDINEKLEAALEEAQAANRSKTQFLNNISHEIRTPMNAIIGFTSLASKNIDDKEIVKYYLSKIEIAGNHLLSLVNNVLDMSRIESGKMQIKEKENSLMKIIETITTVAEAYARSKGLVIYTNTEGIRNDIVMCDDLRLKQVLLNVLGNSLKYTYAGGSVSMSVYQEENESPDYGTYIFKISDTGIGMDKENLDTLFEPFARGENIPFEDRDGSGLGLAITKKIVDSMNGEITVQSEVSKGTEFVIRLPLKIAYAKEITIGTGNDAPELRGDGKSILVVEDNDMNQEIVVTLLNEFGFITGVAENGEVAIDMLNNSNADRFDAVIMDIQMPVMDGYEATQCIRRNKDNRIANIPIIAMTANAFDEEHAKALEAGMNDYCVKPINIRNLVRTILKWT